MVISQFLCTAVRSVNAHLFFISKMKATVLCILVVVALATARPNQKYTDRYDNINVEEVVTNRRLLVPYIKCALNQGKCSAEGRELKSHIKEALETYCQKCTEAQKRGTRRVIAHLINNEGEYWNQLTAKYDPSRKYVQRYENELRIAKTEG